MPRATHDGIELEYDSVGDPEDPTLLLVNGLGGQLCGWDDELRQAFVDRGFRVARFDNRDTGLSTKSPAKADVRSALTAFLSGQPVHAPYLLTDLAADTVAVLDALEVERAHLFGVSMGAMVAQTVAITHPERVASLTSAMSTTGDPDVGQAHPDVLALLLRPRAADREEYVEGQVELFRAIGSPEHFEEDRVRRRAAVAFDRGYHPQGVANQLVAIMASGSRTKELSALDVPTLVLHGDRDRLIDISGGRRTAEVVPGAELVVLEGMGHDLPTFYWTPVVEAVTALAARASTAG